MTFIAALTIILAIEMLFGFVITPLAVKFGHFHGLLDKPDNKLKLHDGNTPHVGGLTVCGLVLGVSVAYHLFIAAMTTSQMVSVGLLCIIFIVGIIDDRHHLPIFLRLAIQIGIAITLIFFGNIFTPTDWPIINVALTILGVLAMINAINMLDGMDGLAGIVSIVAILGLIYSLYHYRADQFYFALGSATIVALVPFLVANFRPNPKKAFLGDGGSTYLGLMLAILFIQSTNVSGRADTASSLLFISIPIFELTFAILLRIWARKNPFKGSKDHFPLRMRILTKSDLKTLICISSMALFFFLTGVGIIHFLTIFKYIVLAVSAIAYLVIWIVLSRVRVD